MPTAQYLHYGDTIDYTPAVDVAAGDVVVLGEQVAFAKRDIKAGELGSLTIKGIFELPKATGGGTALSTGTTAYWDEGSQVVTDDSAAGANKRIGKTSADASDSDATVQVRSL